MLDFGLAKLATTSHFLDPMSSPTEHFSSMAGTTVGTIAYMSPEQARGEDVDPRTDLFSFGVVLYEMATGRQSFPGATTAVVFDGILNREPMPPSTLNAQIPTELDRIISKALEKDRDAALSDSRRHARRSAAPEARLRIAARRRRRRLEQRIRRAAAAERRRRARYPSPRYSSVRVCRWPARSRHRWSRRRPRRVEVVPPPRARQPADQRNAGGLSPKTIGAAAAVVIGLLAIAGVARMVMSSGGEPDATAAQVGSATPPPPPDGGTARTASAGPMPLRAAPRRVCGARNSRAGVRRDESPCRRRRVRRRRRPNTTAVSTRPRWPQNRDAGAACPSHPNRRSRIPRSPRPPSVSTSRARRSRATCSIRRSAISARSSSTSPGPRPPPTRRT